jgi:hypothetical protein
MDPRGDLSAQAALARDESPARFAVTQAADHAVFAYLMLQLPELKARALEIATQFHTWLADHDVQVPTSETFWKFQGARKGSGNGQGKGRSKADRGKGDRGTAEDADFKQLLPLMQQSIAFRERLIDMQVNQKKWTGFGWASFWDHLNHEERFNLEQAQGQGRSARKVKMYHARVIAEHLSFVSHLIDVPSPFAFGAEQASELKRLQDMASEEAQGVYDLSAQMDDLDEMKLLAVVTQHQEIGNLAWTTKPPSVIPPELVLHVAREGERAKRDLELIEERNQASENQASDDEL